MKSFWKMVVCLVSALVLNISLGAGNPYVPIAARNIFGLNPPQPQNIPTPDPPSKITLNGIMTILGTAQALFYVDVPPRPPLPATQKSYILSEGQGQDDIEVTHIDLKNNVVTFNNHGVVQEMPLVKAAPITTPTPVVMNPSGPAMNAGFAGRGGPGGFGGPGGGGNLARFGNNPGQNRNMGNDGGNAGQNNFGNTGPGGVTGSSTVGQAQSQLSPEEQTLLIAAQKAQLKQNNDPMWKIFPTTELDEAAGTVNTTPPGAATP
ncbi:MAG TPA: hypothetical protein VN784_01370 [Candidatus Limnocylindrales bacterium]|nr:hypothetical protein [Candidatus Limnocylindrales bacterium]